MSEAKPLTAEEEAELRRLYADHPGYRTGKAMLASLDAARARIAALEAENRTLRNAGVTAYDRIAALEEGLTFYADDANWRTRGHPQIDAHDTAVNFDRGATARNTIRPHEWCIDPVACRAAGRCPYDPVCGN